MCPQGASARTTSFFFHPPFTRCVPEARTGLAGHNPAGLTVIYEAGSVTAIILIIKYLNTNSSDRR